MPFPARVVLFDLDGTLVHTHIDFARMRAMVLDLLRDVGLDPREFRARDVLGLLAEAAPRLENATEFLARADQALVEIELAACDGAYEAEGARETLEWLRESGARVGIVTRNSPQAVERVLGHIPLPYDVLLTRADTPRVKPDPIHLLLGLERLAGAPEYSVMVGDHTMDVLGGKAAGMRTIGVLLPERPADFFAEAAPDAVIRTLPELRTWISPSSS